MAIDPPLATGATPNPGQGEREELARPAGSNSSTQASVGHQDGDGRQGKDRGDHMLMQTGELRVSDGPQHTFHMLRHHG